MIATERPLAYLVALDLAGRRCVVIGGEGTAARRVSALLDAGAQVTVVAERLDATLESLARRGDVAWKRRAYRSGDLAGAAVAFNTIDDHDLEQDVRGDALRAGVLLNTHDRPGVSDFASPALVRRDRLQIAVSTSGDSPHVAAAVRRRVEAVIGPEWGTQLALIATVRRRLRRAGVSTESQQRAYRALMSSRVRDRLRRRPGASTLLADAATSDALAAASQRRPGAVHLVGAGPGHPDLLTIAARDLLLEADVVFHDALVSAQVLGVCAPNARLVDVGKRAGGQRTEQQDIVAMLIAAARAGETVVRLKGGDPFVFGRGGEELAALRAAGIEAHVVPGVTAAFAAPASVGIPVTFRGVSGSVAVCTGRDAEGEVPHQLARIASAVDTLVVLMPLAGLDDICARLLESLDPSVPAAVIAQATSDDQRVVRAPLGRLADAVRTAHLDTPATLVVGQVVDVLGGGPQECTAMASTSSSSGRAGA